jgi:hypothetical protein
VTARGSRDEGGGGGDDPEYLSANGKVNRPLPLPHPRQMKAGWRGRTGGVPGCDKSFSGESKLSGIVGKGSAWRMGRAAPSTIPKLRITFPTARKPQRNPQQTQINSLLSTLAYAVRSALIALCLRCPIVLPCVVATVRPQNFLHVASFYYVRFG